MFKTGIIVNIITWKEVPMKFDKNTFINISLFLGLFGLPLFTVAQSTLDCSLCHNTNHTLWLSGSHANTQNDVADELAEEWIGLSADSVILGSEAEDCIACHGPIAVTVNGGMTEVEALNHFFTTTNGLFTDSTHAADSTNWPHVYCTTCHNVPTDHPATMPTFALFNSATAEYNTVDNKSSLCGQCHGTLKFSDTDHRVFDAWMMSKHGHGGQADVASELAEEWAGSAPDSVINGSEAEDCIACHAPTSVLSAKADSVISESEALARFFTTNNGVFDESTVPADSANWPDVSCIACHNPHKPNVPALFDSQTGEYVNMDSPQQLCGQCHGNLRFPDTDHLSYNIEAGTGGMGVDDALTMPGVKCVDCHMHVGDVDGSNAAMYGGHTWSIFVTEADNSVTASCTTCHSSMNAAAAEQQIDSWISEFAALDSTAQAKVAEADAQMVGNTDPTKLQYLEEVHHNLDFAESDESGGFHNHTYSMALLNDAIQKADLITGLTDPDHSNLPMQFTLAQNYPNPFGLNQTTHITYQIPKTGLVNLTVYNMLGQKVKELVNQEQKRGTHQILFNASGLASGVYVYKLVSSNRTFMKKMLIIR